jgi:ribosome-associated protein
MAVHRSPQTAGSDADADGFRPGRPAVSLHTAGMAGPLRVTSSVVVPEKELRWRFSRSSGPGGQSVNTADSRVELSLDLTTTTALGPVLRARALERLGDRLVDGVLPIVASEHRSQLANREAARDRMAEVLRAAIAPPPQARRRTKPTRSSVERRLAAKRRRARTKKLRRPDDD